MRCGDVTEVVEEDLMPSQKDRANKTRWLMLYDTQFVPKQACEDPAGDA